jgi:hypothetical protein
MGAYAESMPATGTRVSDSSDDPGGDDPGGDGPLRGTLGDSQPLDMRWLIESALSCALVAMLGLALVPTPRYIAWTALLVVPITLGRRVGRLPGVVAAITSAYVYLLAHGHPRFEMHVTDRLTIRMAFSLGVLGALGAVAASRRSGGLHADSSATGDLRIARVEAPRG